MDERFQRLTPLFLDHQNNANLRHCRNTLSFALVAINAVLYIVLLSRLVAHCLSLSFGMFDLTSMQTILTVRPVVAGWPT
jgi:hypothetical protein